MKLSEFYYDLPKELIAQKPLERRDSSRLMVVDRRSGDIYQRKFTDIVSYLNEGDCLVLNNTRVLPARFYGNRETGGKVEIFLVHFNSRPYKALVRPSKKIKEGERIKLENGTFVKVLGPSDVGRFVEFEDDLDKIMNGGHIPLPPYINRDDNIMDHDRYQTVYASKNGATAAPTAGLHFTEDLISDIKGKGVSIAQVTLHTSYGTFAPVKEELIEEHKMHAEYYGIDSSCVDAVNSARAGGGRIIAVGTTSTRVLETVSDRDGYLSASKGETEIFIYPGYKFKAVDALVTNFHLPGSTLLMLVSALAGKDLIFNAYRKAVSVGYRFFSYGDAMLIV